MSRVLCIRDVEKAGVKLFKKGKIYKSEEKENIIIDEFGDRRIFCLYNNNDYFKPISNKRRHGIEKI